MHIIRSGVDGIKVHLWEAITRWGIPGQIDQRFTPSYFKKSETWSTG